MCHRYGTQGRCLLLYAVAGERQMIGEHGRIQSWSRRRWDWDGQRSFAEYDVFRVDGQQDNYRLHVRGYHGNAGACQLHAAYSKG